MADQKDLYAVLGVPRDASEDDIKKAYRRLAREHHPDVNPGDAAAEERFKEIAFAKEVLLDPEKRRLYDEFGVEGVAAGFDPEQARAYRRWSQGTRRSPFYQEFTGDEFADHGDFEDLLAGLFGRRRAGPRPGRDLEAEVEVDFVAAVRGDEVRVQPADGAPLRVRVPAGAQDGTRVRLAGQGGAGREGGPPGDLYLTLRVRPHPVFSRAGDDLYMDLPVTLPEMWRGAEVEVPTPDGRASVKIPPRSQNGRRLRLRGKGAHRRDGGRGDLLLRLQAVLPEGDDWPAEEWAERLEPHYAGRDVRARLWEAS